MTDSPYRYDRACLVYAYDTLRGCQRPYELTADPLWRLASFRCHAAVFFGYGARTRQWPGVIRVYLYFS